MTITAQPYNLSAMSNLRTSPAHTAPSDPFEGRPISVPPPAADSPLNAKRDLPTTGRRGRPKGAKNKKRSRGGAVKVAKVTKPVRQPKPLPTPDDVIERNRKHKSATAIARAARRPQFPRITTSTLHMSFRFSEDDKDLLCKLALANGLSMSAAMKMALRDSARVQGVVVRKGSGFGVVVDRDTGDEVVVDNDTALEYGLGLVDNDTLSGRELVVNYPATASPDGQVKFEIVEAFDGEAR